MVRLYWRRAWISLLLVIAGIRGADILATAALHICASQRSPRWTFIKFKLGLNGGPIEFKLNGAPAVRFRNIRFLLT